MPPLLAAGVRHLSAGVILFALLLVRFGRSALRLSRRELLGGAFVGLALLLGGNGLVVLAETSVPSGLTALIIAIVPLFVVLLRRIFGERVCGGTYLGVAIGFAGVAVLIIPRGITGQVDLVGMLMLLGASAVLGDRLVLLAHAGAAARPSGVDRRLRCSSAAAAAHRRAC